MELDPLGDMFGEGDKSSPAAPATETSQPTFYIDESDSAKKEPEVPSEPKAEVPTVKEETTTPQQTSRFWSWWSKPKSEAGSKENILEEGEKKAGEEGE